jgi:hypothetical protein
MRRVGFGGCVGRRGQALDDGLQIVAQQHIMQVLRLLAHLAHDALPQSCFHGGRQQALRRIAQRGQAGDGLIFCRMAGGWDAQQQ